MLWMLWCAAQASEPTSEPVVEPAPAGPSYVEQARLNRMLAGGNDQLIAQDAALIQQTLDRYSSDAARVFIGEVVTAYHPFGHAVNGTTISVVVSEVLRGEVGSVVDVHIPPPGAYIHGHPETVPINIVTGYTVILFTDANNQAITSNAVFLVEGGFIWRNKSPDVFLNPRADRDWGELVDPSSDYLTSSLVAVRQRLSTTP